MSWTQERKDKLKDMWIKGKTSNQIAEALGDVTRNAVMGMVNRMGLLGNRTHNAMVRRPSGACRPKKATIPVESPVEPISVLPSPSRDIEENLATLRRLARPMKKTRIVEAPAAGASYVDTSTESDAEVHDDVASWKLAVSMVEEITGRPYSPGTTGHKSSLIAIASILGGGDPRKVLPNDFPEPLVFRTMRTMAEKGIMVGGVTPESWLEPDMGDFNFFIDMLLIEGVITRPRTEAVPTPA